MTNISILAERCDIAQENIHYTPEKYLSDSFFNIKGHFVLLKGSTGFGGTTSALESTGKPILNLTPNISQLTTKSIDLAKTDYCNKSGRKVFIIHGRTEDGVEGPHNWANVRNHNGACNVFTTIDQLIHEGSLRDWILQTFDIIIDEYHQFAPSASFKGTKYTQGILKLIEMMKGTPCRLILSSATYFPPQKLGLDIPVHLFYTDGHGERVSVTHYTDADYKSVLAVIQERIVKNASLYVFTNNIKLLKDIQAFTVQETGEDVNFLTGSTMAKKIAFYTSDSTKSIDPTKRQHIITSAGWMGVDIHDSEAEVIVFGEYSSHKLKNHLLIGEEDLYQIKGRFRTGYKSLELYTKGDELPSFKEGEGVEVEGYNWKVLDALKVVKEYKSSVRFKYKRRSLKKHLYPSITGLTLSQAYKNIKKKAYRVAKYPASFVQHTGADDEKLKKKLIGGMRVQDVLFAMVVAYLEEMDDIIKLYERERLDKSIRDLVGDFYGVMNMLLFEDDLIKVFKGEGLFSSVLVRDDSTFSLNSKRRKALHSAIKSKVYYEVKSLAGVSVQDGLWTFQGSILNKGCKLSNVYPLSLINIRSLDKNTLLDNKEFKISREFLEDYFFLYNAYAPTGSKAHAEVLKHKKEGKTNAQLLKNYKGSVLAYWLILKGRDISTHKGNREYNAFVEGYKHLRYLMPYELLEVDGVSCAIQVLAGWLNSQYCETLISKLNKGDIYDIEGMTRDEAKIYVNTIINKYTTRNYSEKEQIYDLQVIGLSFKEASLFVKRFATKGEWSKFYTAYEQKIMKSVLQHTGGRGARLHDAMYFVNAEVNNVPDSVMLNIEGKPYNIPLKSKVINGPQRDLMKISA